MTINNYSTIIPFLTFESEDDYYLLQVIKRRKDNPNMEVGERVLRTVYITSLEKIRKIYADLVNLADQNNARIYINLNVKSMKKTSMIAMKELAGRVMDDNFKGAYHIFDSAAGQCGATRDKKWIVDLDEKEAEITGFCHYVELLGKRIDGCQPKGPHVLKHIKTPNGVHLITNPFNIKEFKEKMEEHGLHCPDIHKNNPTLLYYNDDNE